MTKVKSKTKRELQELAIELAGLCGAVTTQAIIQRDAYRRGDAALVVLCGAAIAKGQIKIMELATTGPEGDDAADLNLRLQIVSLRDGIRLEPCI